MMHITVPDSLRGSVDALVADYAAFSGETIAEARRLVEIAILQHGIESVKTELERAPVRDRRSV